MKPSATRLVMAFGVVALGIFIAVPLMLYSASDDAPGGVLLGILLMMGAAALSFRVVLGRPTGSQAGTKDGF